LTSRKKKKRGAERVAVKRIGVRSGSLIESPSLKRGKGCRKSELSRRGEIGGGVILIKMRRKRED